jgi:hypothetical protein
MRVLIFFCYLVSLLVIAHWEVPLAIGLRIHRLMSNIMNGKLYWYMSNIYLASPLNFDQTSFSSSAILDGLAGACL